MGIVQQGDLDKQKGVHYSNATDEITQCEAVFSVEHISERYLIPVLAQLLDACPFIRLGLHADNGSEYAKGRVATLLEQLRIEFTTSRSQHSNDNALVESKHGAVVVNTLDTATSHSTGHHSSMTSVEST